MNAEVVSITRERSCRVQLENDILAVFPEVVGHPMHLHDKLRFLDLALDATVRVENLTTGGSFSVYIAANDVHDLRLPVKHGSSRTPTPERLHGV